MIHFKMPLPLAAGETQISPPPIAADALAMLQADPTVTPTQRRDRLSALAAVVRICRPLSEATPSPAAIWRDAPHVPMTCSFLRERLYRQPPAALGFREKRTFENVVSRTRQILRDLGQHAPELPSASGLSPTWRSLHDQLTHD